MKKRILKDKHEEKVLILLKNHFGWGDLPHTKSESPDFVLHFPSDDIGVEVTELLESDKKELSSVKANLTEQVIEKLKTRLPYQFILNIDIEPQNTDKPNNNRRIKELAEIFERIGTDLQNQRQIEFDKFGDDFNKYPEDIQNTILNRGFMPLPEGVSRISISRYDFLDKSFNSQREGGVVPILNIDKIQAVIDKKNKKLPDFKILSAQWLILEEGNGIAGYYANIPDNEIFETVFDRIFIVRIRSNEIRELRIQKP